jgi:hypothetical protein
MPSNSLDECFGITYSVEAVLLQLYYCWNVGYMWESNGLNRCKIDAWQNLMGIDFWGVKK